MFRPCPQAAADIDSLFGKLTEAKKQKKAKESAEQEEAKRPKIKIKKKKAPKEGTPLEGQGEDALQPGQRFDAKRDDLKAKPCEYMLTQSRSGLSLYDVDQALKGPLSQCLNDSSDRLVTALSCPLLCREV